MMMKPVLILLFALSSIGLFAQADPEITVELETYTDDFYGIEVQMIETVKATGEGFEMIMNETEPYTTWEGTLNGQEISFSAGDEPGSCYFFTNDNEISFAAWYPGWIVTDMNTDANYVLKESVYYPCVEFYDLLLYGIGDPSEGHLAYISAIYDETDYCDYKRWNINVFEDTLIDKHADLLAANIMLAAVGNLLRNTHLRKTVRWGDPTEEMASEYPEIYVSTEEHETEGTPIVQEISLLYDDNIQYLIKNTGEKYAEWDVYEEGKKAGHIKLTNVDQPTFIFELWQDTIVILETIRESQWDIRPSDYSRDYQLSSDEPDCFTRMVFESQENPDFPKVYMGIYNHSDTEGCDYEEYYSYYPEWYTPLMDHHAEVAAYFMAIIQLSKRNMWYYWYPKK